MKKSLFLVIALVTAIVTGIFIWFSLSHNHNNDFTIPFFLAVFLAFGFSILTQLELSKVVLATTIGETVALMIEIIIDVRSDPSSHNLFPFEVVIDLIVISFASLIGAGIGFIYRKLKRRKSF